MIRGAGEVGIRKRNPPVRLVTQDIAWRGLAVGAEEEPWLRIHIGVAPAIEDDAGDVASRIESARRKHVRHLLAEHALVLREGSAEQLSAPACALLADRQSGLREQHLDRDHRRRIRTDGWWRVPDERLLRYRQVVTEPLEPAAARYS